MRRVHLALVVVLIAAAGAPGYGAASGSVSGVVRDAHGEAQIGAEVQLLRPDMSVIASVYTNTAGKFVIPSVAPGRYAVKAMGSSFLPSLREDVRVRTATVVNLTLNTLYEVMEWLPSQPRAANTEQDDWKWTLRSAANRPLLRWLEDGPLVVCSDGSGAAPKLKARLMATGQEGAFGESGERLGAAIEETPAQSRELLAQVDFAPGTDAGLESMLGFRQELGFAGSVQSLAAIDIHPEIEGGASEGGTGEGLDEAAIRSSETIHLGDEFAGEVGSTQVLARFQQDSPNTVFAALPFASFAWRNGDSTVGYRLATGLPAMRDGESRQTPDGMPALAMRDGRLVLERGLHQEIGWERSGENSGMSVAVYADRIENPVMEASARQGSATDGAGQGAGQTFGPGQVLFDPASGMLRAAGPGFSSYGVVATAQHRLPSRGNIRLTYASGSALTMNSSASPAAQPGVQTVSLPQVLASAHARRAQTFSIALSGTLEGTGTRWRATYRWQPAETVTPVAAYAESAAEPYLNVQLRQPIHMSRGGAGGFEALVNLRNLLAQGYQPYLLSDGSVVVFAEAQRGVSGGFAFTF
jgi:hypothetical protein